MKIRKMTLLIGLLAGLLLAACQPAVPIDTPPVEEPPFEGEYVYGREAVVESLEVLLLESFPLQATAVLQGYLSDGCLELVEVTVEHQEQDFILTLTTRRPAGDVMCTEALVPFEKNVSLDIAGLKAGTYTVIAQDQRAQFTLDVDNVLDLGPALGGEGVVSGSEAVVESLGVLIMESYPLQVRVELSGYLPDGCTTIREIETTLDGNTFSVHVATQRPEGDVACTMALVPFNEQVDLAVEGLPAGEYTVRVDGLSERFTLDMDN